MTENCRRIASFSVDHDLIVPGVYLSRVDGDVATYDLRTRTPNHGVYMSARTMHSVEHLFATFARNSRFGDRVIYFGPMGCRTGFYLLVRSMTPQEVHDLIVETLEAIVAYNGPMPGAARKECGNFKCLSLADAKAECAAYLPVAAAQPLDFAYPKGADLT